MSLSSIISQIKESINFLDLLDREGIDYKKVGKNHICSCPFHDEKSPSFTIFTESNTAKCFGCDWHGDLIDFHKTRHNQSVSEACNDLISLFGLNIPMSELESKSTIKTATPKRKKKPKLLPLPHLDLPTLPDEKRVPQITQRQQVLTEADIEVGGKMKVVTCYQYHGENDPYHAFKYKIELFNAVDSRITLPNGKEKDYYWNSCLAGETRKKQGKGQFKGICYNFPLAKELGKNKIIIVCEGEKDVETLRVHGFLAISFDSSNYSQILEIECDGILHLQDNDLAGQKKGESLKEFCQTNKIPYLSLPITTIWDNAPQKADITDYYYYFNNPSEFRLHLLKKLEEIFQETQKQPIKEEKEPVTIVLETESEDKPKRKTSVIEKAFQDLYLKSEERYISLYNHLYKWVDTHYQRVEKEIEIKRISEWIVEKSPKSASSGVASGIWSWACNRLSVSVENLNPPGLNLANGILRITWDGKKPIISLDSHNPDEIYDYVSPVRYDENADPTYCDQLLEILDPPERSIFLRSLAISLDYEKYTQHQYRPRALLLKGTGTNGKDALRGVVEQLLGRAMISATINDFHSYDNQKKDALSKLLGAKISWSSENSSFARLDSLDSLKTAITGETIDIKYLYKDEKPYQPRCVYFFNCNETPNFRSGLDSTATRWAVIHFKKTFKNSPDKAKGELQADPRFKGDKDFIREQLAPALLNKILKELEDLLIVGMDYSPIDSVFKRLRAENNHLFQFCQDSGIIESSEGKISVDELWEKLKDWYLSTGALEIEINDKGKEKLIWYEQAKKGDGNVKGKPQIFKRFSEIFPKITRDRQTTRGDSHGRVFLTGICFSDRTNESSGEDAVKTETLTTVSGEHGEGDSLANFQEKIKTMPFEEKSQLLLSCLTPDEIEALQAMRRKEKPKWGRTRNDVLNDIKFYLGGITMSYEPAKELMRTHFQTEETKDLSQPQLEHLLSLLKERYDDIHYQQYKSS